MDKEQIIRECDKMPLMVFMRVVNFIGAIGAVSGLLVWIWIDGYLALKIFASSMILLTVSSASYSRMKKKISVVADEFIEKNDKCPQRKSKFRTRLEEMQRLEKEKLG